MTLRLMTRFLLSLLCFSFYMAGTDAQSEELAKGNIFRHWKRITIPGAHCGNGGPYSVFYDDQGGKVASKLAVEIMGGGACWDVKTCLGPTFTSWPFQMPEFPLYGQFSLPLKEASIAYGHNYIYFPYCTGDVHAGMHIAEYIPGAKVFHYGSINITRTLSYLAEKQIIDFSAVQDFILYGASAGAIGALAHATHFDEYIPQNAKRTLVADAPGLHWGSKFWDKFRAPLVRDFSRSFAQMGVTLDMNEGNLGQQVVKICGILKHWNVGLLQGTRDLVMSQVFGAIAPEEHERLIFSEKGMFNLASQTSNCSVWAPTTYMHTFMIAPTSLMIKAEGVSALDFARQIYAGNIVRNYRSK